MIRTTLIALCLGVAFAMPSEAGKGDRKERMKQRFKEADADQSGTLSLEEFTVLHAKKAERMRRRAPERAKMMPTAEDAFSELDTDSDGEISRGELAKGRKRMHQERKSDGENDSSSEDDESSEDTGSSEEGSQ